MIYSIVSLNDIFYAPQNKSSSPRSSNPYDYIRCGYYLDNASLYGGKSYVDYKNDIASYRSGDCLDIPYI